MLLERLLLTLDGCSICQLPTPPLHSSLTSCPSPDLLSTTSKTFPESSHHSLTLWLRPLYKPLITSPMDFSPVWGYPAKPWTEHSPMSSPVSTSLLPSFTSAGSRSSPASHTKSSSSPTHHIMPLPYICSPSPLCPIPESVILRHGSAYNPPHQPVYFWGQNFQCGNPHPSNFSHTVICNAKKTFVQQGLWSVLILSSRFTIPFYSTAISVHKLIP